MWEALEVIKMKDKIEMFADGLDTDLSESTASFSVGESQLICVARALLKQSKILLVSKQ